MVEDSRLCSTTVAAVVDSYLRFASSRLAQNSYKARRGYLLSLKSCIGNRSVADCTPLNLLEWVDAHPEWSSDWTKHSVISYVQTAFNWAADTAKIIPKNPFTSVAHPEGLPRRDVTPEEFQTMLRASAGRSFRQRPSPGARFRLILIFLRFTGARPHEAAQLKWSHINLERRVIILPNHKTVRTQRRPLPRVILLHPVTIKLLCWIKRNQPVGEFVFLTFRATPWNRHSLAQRVRRAREAAGIADDAKLYGVRHAFGTRAIINGCDIKTLATLMGHTSTKMTERYIHLAGQNDHLRDAINRVNRRLE